MYQSESNLENIHLICIQKNLIFFKFLNQSFTIKNKNNITSNKKNNTVSPRFYVRGNIFKKTRNCTWGSSSVVNREACFAPVPSSILYVHVCYPRDALPTHWACRMFSGPWGIFVVRASWPGHPTLIKKKNKDLISDQGRSWVFRDYAGFNY